MSEEGGFLNRWSRRKAEARKEPEPVADGGVAVIPSDSGASSAAEAVASGEVTEVDLSKLPAIDSIDALTDIKGFLAKGVPDSLRAAALRQVWAADPAIRDYIGPYDYAWDFNTPTVHGFGEIAPGTDVASIVRTIMEGHGPTVDSIAEAVETLPADGDLIPLSNAASVDAEEKDGEAPIAIASLTSEAPESAPSPELSAPFRRRHGGATPR